MFQDTTGTQPQIVFLVRTFMRWFIRGGNDVGPTIRSTIEVDTVTFRNVGVIPFPVTPQGFLAINHWPTQTTHLVIMIKFTQFMAFLWTFQTENTVFFVQALLYIETKVIGLIILVDMTPIIGDGLFRVFIHLAITE